MGSHIVVFIILACKDEGRIRGVLSSITATDYDTYCVVEQLSDSTLFKKSNRR